jgi:hypothetical protein
VLRLTNCASALCFRRKIICVGNQALARFGQRVIVLAVAIGIGQRDLVLARADQLRPHVVASCPPSVDRGDLLGQFLDRRAACFDLGDAGPVKPLQIIVKLASAISIKFVYGREAPTDGTLGGRRGGCRC